METNIQAYSKILSCSIIGYKITLEYGKIKRKLTSHYLKFYLFGKQARKIGDQTSKRTVGIQINQSPNSRCRLLFVSHLEIIEKIK